MVKKHHGIGFQALNQARTATHARDFLAGYRELVVADNALASAFHNYGELFSVARKAMREMAIINTASVLDKQPHSTGMLSLIKEVKVERPDLSELCGELKVRLDAHKATFANAVVIRSNILAHRSKQLTYKEVHEKAALSDEALGAAIEAWLAVAQELSRATRGEVWSATLDAGSAARRLLNDIASGVISRSDQHG
ncbi:hypothetical protein H9L13_05040 [Sphingomonas lutea]|uniref:HEPN AbiU2-like domain-containing protein n=1 Tax=Sphingomonas lutea TaxID=1045317 RepID=A0A7G9SK68_9SPHN|nr:hypothetical protein [Sphingomonas lutea]QNN68243.1 hypothetical protein H9L13_05040 [Sphingomonas lutea]